MPEETELKLAINKAAIPAFRRHPLLKNSTPTTRQLRNIYYDTPNLQLRALGVALRFREYDDHCLLTIKSGGAATGGLTVRAEWEYPAKPGTFDFNPVTDPALKHFLEAHRTQLRPIFTTHFTRHTWLVKHDKTTIEVALDEGEISTSKHQVPICEVELELKSGNNSNALFALALKLSDTTQLHPEMISKAERGYRLHRTEPLRPTRALASTLQSEMTLPAAFARLAWLCLQQLQANEAGVLHQNAPEFVHQARVAIRRLRSAIHFFGPILPPIFKTRYAPAWQNVGIALAAARDWEVIRHDTLPTLTSRHHSKTINQQQRRVQKSVNTEILNARDASRKALQHPGYSRLLLEFSAAIHALEHSPGNTPTQSLTDFAHRRLKRAAKTARRRASLKEINRPDILDATALHRLRIATKKLRYGLDFTTPLLPEPATQNYRDTLSKLQDTLGELHDLDVALHLLETLTPPEALASYKTVAERRRQHQRRLLRQHWSAMQQNPRPWKTK